MKLYKYQAEAYKKLMDVLQHAKYVKSDGSEIRVGTRVGWGCVLTTRNGRIWVKNKKGHLFEFTPEVHNYDGGSKNLVVKVSDHSFRVHMSVKLIQAFNDYWGEVLKPAHRMQTDAFSDIEATQSSVRVRQFDGRVFEWVSE